MAPFLTRSKGLPRGEYPDAQNRLSAAHISQQRRLDNYKLFSLIVYTFAILLE